ncbi:MAG TPA: methionine synthase [Firmicutes bacterium]|nr:methionine synthase [Bacillota bacterium]
MKRIVEYIKSGRVLVSDGAWGTLLFSKGLKPGECPEEWCVSHPDVVLQIAKNYIDAGSDLIETNSFGASAIKLAHYKLDHRASELNESAAKISRTAAGNEKFVLGSIGPTGRMLIMGALPEEKFYDSFSEQAVALEKGGADAICIETMSDIDEARIAIKAAKENTGLEIVCTFTFDRTRQGEYVTMMGIKVPDVVKAVLEAGADIIGSNCGNGTVRMIEIVRMMRDTAPDVPILVQPNAGSPSFVNGNVSYDETPEIMAGYVPDLIRAGANIIGGCCGTTPEHIRAIKNSVLAYSG